MTIDDFFALLEPERGNFCVNRYGEIRHKTKFCCPIATAFGGCDMEAWDTALKHGMTKIDAANVMSAADDNTLSDADDDEALRQRLLSLCEVKDE